jgi:endonuclease/exonuclease/phosphatase (EEP) superfamily protein YafD
MRGPTRRVLGVLCWVVAVGLAGVCLLRAVHADHRTVEIDAISIAPLLLLVAWPLLAVAALRRRWVLFVVALALVVCDVVWEGPVLSPIDRAPAAAAGVAPWRLFDANVAQDNFDLTEMAHEIRVDHPEVVSLEEFTPGAYASLKRTGILSAFPWQDIQDRSGPGGMALLSRVPLSDLHTWDTAGQVEIQGWVHPTGQPAVRLDVVHVFAPVGFDQPTLWRHQLALVRSHLEAEPRPLVVAGDFNSTADLGPFQQILHLGLSDAAVLAGKGWEMTWPRNQAWVIPYLRIDHVLLSPTLTVTGYWLGDGKGSDHHPVIVDIAPRR